MKKKKPSSQAGKTSLRGTGCLSSAQAGRLKKHNRLEGEDPRERNWMERLKQDMERAERYFWSQTADRRKTFAGMRVGQSWGSNDFCFGKGTTA